MPVFLAALLALAPGTRMPGTEARFPGLESMRETTRDAEAQPPDRWLAWDKFWHFSASFVSVGAGYHLCANRLDLEHRPAAGISIGGTFGLGLGKELLDRYGHRRRFSWKDMAANALGITAGYFVFVHEY